MMEFNNDTAAAIPSHLNAQERSIWQLLHQVHDPEVPVLSIHDLGIVRNVACPDPHPGSPGQQPVTITITPTYSGCPAMDVIGINIRMVLLEAGYKNIQIKTVLSPPWTTDWMTDTGKNKLKAYGIAPPNAQHSVCNPQPFAEEQAVQCPRCNSYHTQMVSRFGSTACKALYRCLDCREPFDYFKCH